ncbi:MAG: CHC2 zinc finger domain-containing protein [Candidatus Scalindua sp.]
MITYSQIGQDAEGMGVGFSWALERRKSFLACEIVLRTEAITNLLSLLAGKDSLNRELILTWMQNHNEAIKKLEKEMSCLKPVNNNLNGKITNDMILRAKEYPIRNLLSNPVKNNMTNCISHNDRTPSMSIKNNRAYCFSCGYKGDSISVYMRLNGADFKTAVMDLN